MRNRIDQSVSNLLNIIKEQDKQLQDCRLLVNFIVVVLGGGYVLDKSQSVDVFHNLNDLLYYMRHTSYDYLILIIPGIPPRAFDREVLDKMTEEGTLEDLIREQWREETVALAI